MERATAYTRHRTQSGGRYSKKITLPKQALQSLGVRQGDSIEAEYDPESGVMVLGNGGEIEVELIQVGNATGITIPSAIRVEQDICGGEDIFVSSVGDSIRLRF